ncbi:hypothetical protein N0V83_005763 [Neocucurbitaria cava]|uniref:F-box domain-containing protein n=1 Tax=Neocucurbitaria cava TaxID=798079 RepID=A0A9W9CLK7_9PLEO|nr:hypothetical protein N0V83_005763 [Neocucurbitaria cava]
MASSSTPALRRSYDELPIELKREVCTYLPNSDLKTVRLLNDEWNHVASSPLFRVFTTNLVETKQRKLNTLLVSPARGGFVNSVKELNIRHQTVKTITQDVDSKLLRLLRVLPNDRLKKFSTNANVEESVISSLLQNQTQLRRLFLAYEFYREPPDSLPSIDLVQGSLQALESMTIFANGKHEDAYATWLPELAALRILKIEASQRSRRRTHNFTSWASPTVSSSLKLRTLTLENVRLPAELLHIVNAVHLPSLKNLFLFGCTNTEPLLDLMAQQLQASNSDTDTKPSKSKTFRYECLVKPSEDRLHHVQRFLSSITGLQAVLVDAVGSTPLAISSLESHSASLERLMLSFPTSRRSATDNLYTVRDLTQLVDTCPNLRILGISLANIDFEDWLPFTPVGVSLSPSNGPLGSIATTPEGLQIAQALVPLSRVSHLRTLVLTQVPYEQFQSDPAARIHRHTSLATEIFTFLAAHNSPVSYIVFHPVGYYETTPLSSPSSSIVTDASWPNFCYRRGKVVSDSAGPAFEGVVAIPMSREEFAEVELCHRLVMRF